MNNYTITHTQTGETAAQTFASFSTTRAAEVAVNTLLPGDYTIIDIDRLTGEVSAQYRIITDPAQLDKLNQLEKALATAQAAADYWHKQAINQAIRAERAESTIRAAADSLTAGGLTEDTAED